MKEQRADLDILLLHHPVTNKTGETIGSAVTNLDLHDIARVARTYGVSNYYVATPYEDQHELINEITAHWLRGHGATYNPARKEALALVKAAYNLEAVIDEIKERNGASPLIVTTSARKWKNEVQYDDLRYHLRNNSSPVLLLFGTAHGIADEVMERADAALPPICGNSTYNHLSVRSAVSIILDRLLGR